MPNSIPLIKQFIAVIRMKPFENSREFIEGLAQIIIADLNLKVVDKVAHNFTPVGITFGFILSQSHLIMHTFPEDGVLHIDLVVCSDRKKEDFKSSLEKGLTGHEVYSIELKAIDLNRENGKLEEI